MRCPKPAKGTAQRARARARGRIERAEAGAKLAARKRDGGRCRRCGRTGDLEGAHLRTKGMGGDHGTWSHHRRHFLTLCHDCHQGPISLHSGHLVAVYGDEMGDGMVTFEARHAPIRADRF